MSGLTIRFQGLDAEQGHLDAFTGIESAAGIARALAIVGHYAATGVVRHRFPFDQGVQFYLEATEPGSFSWKLKVVASTVALGLATNGVYDLSKLVLSRAVGDEPIGVIQQVQELNETRSGDIDALVEAITPALQRAHYGIGETATQILIEETTSKKLVVKFDSNSKDYLKLDIDSDDDAQDVSVSALNVNDKTGRVYFLDLKRTVPFRISKDAEPKTVSILSDGLNRYANQNAAPIRITFSRIESSDGRLKRIIILKAEDISAEE